MPFDAIGVGDVGGSGGRVSALVRKGDAFVLEPLHEFSHPSHTFYLTGESGKTERRRYWNPYFVYDGLCDGLRRAAADPSLRIVSFGVDSWGSDGLWISERGDAVMPAVQAHDEQWAEARAEVEWLMPGRERFDLTGTYPDAFLVVNQVYWATLFRPEMVDAAWSFMPLTSLYHYWFSGVRALEFTWGTTGHLGSCVTGRYCDEVFDRLRLPREKMPPFRRTGGVLGPCIRELSESLGLAPFEVMATANHDTACAFAAAPVRSDRLSLVVSAGTWWCMGAPLARPLVNGDVFASGFSNVGGADGGVVLNVINMGSFAAQALRRQWSREDGRDMSWDAYNGLAHAGRRPDLVFDIDDPRLRVAADMARTVAEVAGLRPDAAERGRLAALVYVGLARKTAKVAKTLGRLLGRDVDEILVVGGGARNDFMNRWLAAVSGLPVRTGSPGATTLGNALVQACSLGWFSNLREGRRAVGALWEEKVFEPEKSLFE